MLAHALHGAIERAAGGSRELTILYSGGLDSSVIAWVLRPARPRLFTIGAPGSADLESARSGARELGLPVEEGLVNGSRVRRTLDRWAEELVPLKEPARSVAVATALALEMAPPGRLLMGQGADELFLGYAHFRGLSAAEARLRQVADWSALVDRDWPRAQRIARALGRELVSPYLDHEVEAAARACAASSLGKEGEPMKPMLRAAARVLGLPDSLATRPKRALQYGSGVARLLREADRTALHEGGANRA